MTERQTRGFNQESELAEAGPGTRLIAMGGRALMEGFALIGFETWPEATEEDLDKLLGDLERGREEALVLLEPSLSRSHSARLAHVRAESPSIIVIEIPPLHAPDDYRPAVEDLVVKLLGSGALEEKTSAS